MAYTSLGVAYSQELAPVTSWVDPWGLASIPLSAFFVWRIIVTLNRRSEEAVYWLGAAAGFAPISQIFPFDYPVADRYLYFILPGLIGGTLLLVRAMLICGDASRVQSRATAHAWARAGLVAAAAVLLMFTVHSYARARLWTDETYLVVDSAQSFPDGRAALYLNAREAAQRGDLANAVQLLRRLAEMGRDDFRLLVLDPSLQPNLQEEPRYKELVDELARRFVARVRSRSELSQSDLGALAQAYFELEEFEAAERALEAAIARGGVLAERFAREAEIARAVRVQIEAQRALRLEDRPR
jgi:tetratricopeptide (TPR) repeat protein